MLSERVAGFEPTLFFSGSEMPYQLGDTRLFLLSSFIQLKRVKVSKNTGLWVFSCSNQLSYRPPKETRRIRTSDQGINSAFFYFLL